MPSLRPWVYGPFEVLYHAELHFRSGEDFDRRIAMIGFDNAVEVSISTYLTLNPIQRGNRSYARVDVDRWMDNFHSKVDFFFDECARRKLLPSCRKDELVWFHDIRNGQYHGGGPAVPQRRELEGCRGAAMEIFGVLFEESNVQGLLDAQVAGSVPAVPPRSDDFDTVIDNAHGMVELCGQLEYSSDVLYAVDPIRYKDTALRIMNAPDDQEGAESA